MNATNKSQANGIGKQADFNQTAGSNFGSNPASLKGKLMSLEVEL
jgi:hypothetical protein